MSSKLRTVAIALIVFVSTVGLVSVYGGDFLQLSAAPLQINDDDTIYDPYPVQYLPAVVKIPAPTPTAPPLPTLHVGVELQWDGSGYIYFDDHYWSPGTHHNKRVDQQIDGDTVRVYSRFWYSPNPFDWDEETWYCYYNNVTNRPELCSSTDDPGWRWGYPWIMPPDVALENGKTVTIDGQVFDVTGPHELLTGYGELAFFWRLVNRDRFLYHYNGGEWKQYVEVGDAILFYEATSSRLLLYYDITRTYYKNDNWTGDTVRYEALISKYEGLRNRSPELADASEDYSETQVAIPPEIDAMLLRQVIEERAAGDPHRN